MPMFQSTNMNVTGGYFVENQGDNNPINFNTGSGSIQTVYGYGTNTGNIIVADGASTAAAPAQATPAVQSQSSALVLGSRNVVTTPRAPRKYC